MSEAKRATVYFDPLVHRALRLKAAACERSISDLVNDAVKLALSEDAEDLAAFDERATEPALDFEGFVKSLRARGRL
ncbi:MAG: CopG family transcriptional regulator [Thermoanaerobaculaceae bacterium]